MNTITACGQNTCNTLRNDIFAIENVMLHMPQLELELKHHFSEGIYARELIIPKNTVLVGKIHKYKSLNILLKGKLDVLIDNEIHHIEAPVITIADPGMKRIAYAHEDSIWLTIHRTDEMNLAKIEETFIAQSEQEWLEFCKREPKLPFEPVKEIATGHAD